MNASPCRFFRITVGLLALAAVDAIFSSGLRAQDQPVERVSTELRSAVEGLGQGQTIPVIIEFDSVDEVGAAPVPVAPPGRGLEVIEQLRTRSVVALRGLDAAAAPADDAVTVNERLWVVPAALAEVTAAGLERLLATPGVRRVISDEPLRVVVEPGAGAFAPPSFTSDAMRTIGADAVWDDGNTGDGMVIAVFDSGVDGANAMVSNRWRGHRTSTRASWFDPFRRASTPQDLIGHGTQVAVAAVGALAAGDTLEFPDGSTVVASSGLDVVTGTAPEAEWIAARVFDNFGSGLFTRRSVLLQAFQWALDPDGNPSTDDAPDVINNSWGILPTSGFDLCGDVLYDAIDAAEAAGIAVVFSSGNVGPSAGSVAFPAARDDANLRNFAVGASSGTTTIAVADFSGRGPSPCGGGIKPELLAPGTVPEVRFDGPGRARLTGFTVQGTSFSTGQVSGALALVRQAHPGDTPETSKRRLINSAVDVGAPGPDNDAGHGLLDVPAALTAGGSLVAGRRLQVAGASLDSDGLVVRLRNRGAEQWPGGELRIEPVEAGAVAAPFGSAATADLPGIRPGGVLAAHLAWPGAQQGEDGTALRVIVTDRAGEVVLSRLVYAGPPDNFGGFVLTDGNLSAGANDFGRLGRIAATQGFVWQGTELLPAGGIAIAAGSVVSDGWYATTLGQADLKRFAPAAETDWAPQRTVTDVLATTADTRFDDFEALTPAGLEVTARYAASESGGAGALRVVLTVRNRSAQGYPDLVAGLLADWDLAGGEDIRWDPGLEALIAEPLGGTGPVALIASDTTITANVELPLGTPGVGSFYDVGSGVLADSLLDSVKLNLLRGGSSGSLPGAGTATDNAALLGVGPFNLGAGQTVTVRFWLLAAADETAAAARLAELRAEVVPPPVDNGEQFAAEPPYPNPFTPGTGVVRFPYTLSASDADAGGDMALEIYDLAGRRLYRQSAGLSPGGTPPEFTWDGRVGSNDAASGMYMYVIRLGDRVESGRVMVVR